MLTASAVWFLVGLVLAGLLWHFFRARSIARLLAGNNRAGVLRAALIGLPLPLCSCSVLPVASQLRKSGAGRGAVAAFLVSTPETGVDSIALTYSLTDPILTVARPVSAFVTALVAGGLETAVSENHHAVEDPVASSSDTACCDSCAESNSEPRKSLLNSIKYAFTDLLGDLAGYLLFGFLVAGLVGALFGQHLTQLPDVLRSGWGGYLGAIVAGLPLYICASSSTPLAAVLLAGGFSPGMVLVFMMTGAATNLSTIAVIRNILGAAGTVRYLLSIVVVSVLFGLLTDWTYRALSMQPVYRVAQIHESAMWYDQAAAGLLGALMLYWTLRKLSNRLRSFFLKNP